MSLSGCLDDNSACIEDQPGYQEGNDVWLSFKVSNMGESTRTRAEGDEPNDDANHPDEAAIEAENFINTSDIALMFFDDRKTLWKVFQPGEYVIESTGNAAEYNLKFKMNKDYFSYAKGKEQVDYSLMIVANIKGLKGENGIFDDNLFAYTPQRIGSEYKFFSMPDQSTNAWMPSIELKDLIPMAGIAKGSFASSILEQGNTWETAAEIGDVYMQRCLAKIRVLDAIPLQEDAALEGGRTAQITEVKLVGANTKGAYIPYFTNTDWYNGTNVVESATEQSDWFDGDAKVTLLNTEEAYPSVVDKKEYPNQFYCYVPESLVSGRNTKLQITVDFGAEKRTFDVHLANPYGSSYNGISNIARNHIYEYIVNATMASLELKLHVEDWESITTDWDYKENPTVAEGGYLTWSPAATGNSIKLTSGNTATGTFRFSDPIGGIWYASLIPEGNTESNAFRFIDGEGKPVSSISGVIGNEMSSIKIKAMLDAGIQRSARLKFTVKTLDGRTLSGDVIKEDGSYFTIEQTAKL